jgi:hypothetical protein
MFKLWLNRDLSAAEKFKRGINQYGLYCANNSQNVDELLEAMVASDNHYYAAEFNDTGTNLKLWIYGSSLLQWMIFKPKRYLFLYHYI